MILPVVLLPDTALLVPGVAGRADPLAGMREAAVLALADAWAVAGVSSDVAVLVIAPGSRDRELHRASGMPGVPGVRGSLVAAGVPIGLVPEVGPAEGARADVPASVALHLLHAAGVPLDGVHVREVARSRAGGAGVVPADPADLAAGPGTAPGGTAAPDLVVVVGSLSARDGEDAPLAADPAAPALDATLLAALGAGPAALATVLDGPEDLTALTVSGDQTWRALTALLAEHGLLTAPVDAEVLASTAGTALGAHAVARWSLTRTAAPNAEEPR